LLREEAAQRRGHCLRRTVAAMKPEAQLRPRQDAQQAKDAMEATSFPAKGDVAGSALLRNGLTGTFPDAGKANLPTIGKIAPAAACGHRMEARCGSFMARRVACR
jgi:hypothetical protein